MHNNNQEDEMKRFWAIAVFNAAELRDYKLKKIVDNSVPDPEWRYLLKCGDLSSLTRRANARAVWTRKYTCALTQKSCIEKITSCSHWKTENGAKNVAEKILCNQKILATLQKSHDTTITIQAVEITDYWINTVNSLIAKQTVSNNKKLQRFYNKLK